MKKSNRNASASVMNSIKGFMKAFSNMSIFAKIVVVLFGSPLALVMSAFIVMFFVVSGLFSTKYALGSEKGRKKSTNAIKGGSWDFMSYTLSGEADADIIQNQVANLAYQVGSKVGKALIDNTGLSHYSRLDVLEYFKLLKIKDKDAVKMVELNGNDILKGLKDTHGSLKHLKAKIAQDKLDKKAAKKAAKAAKKAQTTTP